MKLSGMHITLAGRNAILILLFCIAYSAIGQTPAATEYTVKRFSSKNGLPQNSIKSMVMDESRYLWMSTEGGLVRFDGQHFITYNHHNHPGIGNDRFMSILKTPNNKLFVNEWSGNAFLIKNGVLKSIPSKKPSSYFKMSFKGGLPDESLFFYNNPDSIFGIPVKELDIYPLLIYILKNNLFAIRHKKDIVIFRDNEQIASITRPTDIENNSFVCDGILYTFDKNRDLYYLDIDRRAFIKTSLSGQLSNEEYKSTPLFKNIIWNFSYPDVHIKIQNKLYAIRRNPDNNTLLSTLITSNLPSSCFVSDAFYDSKSRSLFIGTDTKGLYIFREKIFKTLLFTDTIRGMNNSYYSQVAIDSNTVFTTGGRLFTIEGGRQSEYGIKNFNQELLYYDKEGNIWQTRFDSLIKYSTVNHKTTVIAAGNKSEFVCLREDKEGILMATTRGVGIVSNDRYKEYFETPIAGPDSRTEDIIRGPDGKLWVANCLGVTRFELPSGKAETLKELNDVCARAFFRDGNRMLIGTYGNGYFVWENGKITKPPVDRQNFLSHVHSFLIDGKNNLWMSSNKGLFRIPYDHLVRYLSDSTVHLQYEYFGDDDGIVNTEFNGGCSPPLVRLKNGYVSYPSMEGLVWFIPENISATVPDEKINFDKIDSDGKPLPLYKTVIPSSHELIRIEFSTPYWGNKSNLNLEYFLEGLNEEWIPLESESSTLTFSSLHSGNYRLMIRKLNTGNGSDYIVSEFKFSVEKRFYELWWFRLISAIAILSLIVFLFRLNTARVRNKNMQLETKIMERTKELQLTNQLLESNIDQLAEKELFLKESIATKDKLISVISHDIITPLKFISMVSRISKKNPDMIDRSKLIESMNDIEFASEKLYNNAKNILNWMKLQNNKINPQLHHIAVHEYIDEISEPLKGMAEIKGIAIINHVNEEDIIITDRNIFMIILQNILTNAIKYTEKGRIQVSANRDFGKYTIVVEDTGIGMSKETLAEIDRIRMGEPGGLNKAPKKDTDIGNQLGYIIISDLLTMIGGDFKIVSFPGIGSKVSIILQQSESSSA